ncbi:hypothetical protein DFH11DRAFT_172893 [Phellopilus nigrolimitatus]|nr:hypothetical protein DFH11DRAFT_172893 [Phellopilus nigrolimitatus]
MPELVNFSSGSGSDSGTVVESDIETSSSHDSDVSRDGPGISIPNGSAPETVPSVPSSTDASRSGRNSFTNGHGINWWRMYRFPPMQIPQSRQQGAAMNGLSSGPTAAPADRPLNAQVAVETSTSNSTEASTSHTPPLREPSANLVVPVIVVGLQSINSNIHRTPPPAPGSTSRTEEVNGAREAREARGHDTDNIASTAESQRGRPWPSRAARAFGRLGRRGTTNPATHDQDVQDTLGNGARTFFIYVFGGYYPPDHHILTSTDSLDSFETLWELAELLGQVKPPVVTEEEIERSGLQVFKANSLEEFERNEQVASNCVDRCLICLDDYKPEDDLRLLSCKHAFHKACVDQWLKTGRNNCPACRSKGVKTEEQNTSRASTM